jgi:SagB-type dehydrogenase family enzyme
VELYVLANRVSNLAAGLYHYGPRDHALARLKGEEAAGEISSSVEVPGMVTESPAVLVFSLIFARTGQKYSNRAFRYAALDLGHVFANVAAVAVDLGRSVAPIGRFDDSRLERSLGIDGLEEGAFLIVPLSAPPEATCDRSVTWAFRLPPDRFPKKLGVSGLVQRATSLDLGQRRPELEGAIPPHPGPLAPYVRPRRGLPPPGPWIDLPTPVAGKANLLEAIRKRRSRRRFQDRSISMVDLSSMLFHAASTADAHDQKRPRSPTSTTPSRDDDRRPGVERGQVGLDLSRGLSLRFVAQEVESLSRGLYVYDRIGHRIRLVRSGDLSSEASSSTVNQRAIEQAPLVVVFSVDLVEALAQDGVRCYRYALLDSGRMAGNLYLDGISRGLGVCSIGAFHDDEALGLVGANPNREIVLHFVAVGPGDW